MRALWTIAKREIHSFFVSATAYVVLTMWLIVQGMSLSVFIYYFAMNPISQGGVSQTPLTLFFGGSSIFYIGLLVAVPLLTMRLIADEKKTGSLEMLMTAPVTEWQIVLGKYVAGMVFWIVIWLPTLLYVWILSRYGDIDLGVVASSYLGVLGLGAYYMAIGLFASTIAPSQIVAAVLTFLAVMVLFLISVVGFVVTPEATDIVSYLSVWTHMETFAKGIVDTRYLVFEGTTAAAAIFASVRVLQSRRYF